MEKILLCEFNYWFLHKKCEVREKGGSNSSKGVRVKLQVCSDTDL